MQYEKLESLVRNGVVTDAHIEAYLQGIEYAKWAEGKDLNEVDEDGNLLHVYEPVEVDVELWKRNNYAMLRAPQYPNITEYLDAIVKGDNDAIEVYKAKCLEVKAKFPK